MPKRHYARPNAHFISLYERRDSEKVHNKHVLLGMQLYVTSSVILKTTEPIPVDTGRKLNVHKMFRRLPGRLLNVLCTFNLLRPVSTRMM